MRFWIFITACGIFLLVAHMWSLSCSMLDLILWSGIKLRPPPLGSLSLSHWTTRGITAWCFFGNGVRWLRWWRIWLQCGRPRFQPWNGKIPWRRKWQPIPVFLPGKVHGQWSLVGCSPWGYKELDRTEQLTLSLWVKIKWWSFPSFKEMEFFF